MGMVSFFSLAISINLYPKCIILELIWSRRVFCSVNFITVFIFWVRASGTIFLNILYVLVKVEALGTSHFHKTCIETKGMLFSRSSYREVVLRLVLKTV